MLTAMLAVTLRSVKPELGAQTAAAGGVVLMLAAAGELSGIAEAVKRFVSMSGIGADPAALVLKVAGIAYIAQTASDICRDMGEASLASGAELCGRLMMLSAALPMLTELIDSLAELIGEYL